jgi:hypothetical protein
MKRYSLLGIFYLLPVILSLFLIVGAAESAKQWELLGRQEVNFRGDHDRIDVGRQEGRFKELQIRVEGAPIEMRKMVVTFGNDETYTPNLRQRFAGNSRSRNINLPGNNRTIKTIDFDYASLDRRQERATVAVYGR